MVTTMNAQNKVNDEFYSMVHTKVLKCFKVAELEDNFAGCLNEIVGLKSAAPNSKIHIHGGLSFDLQCQVLKGCTQNSLPFMIYGRKFETAPDKEKQAIGVIVTRN